MYKLHYDGPNAWVLTLNGNLVGHIVRAQRGGFMASTPRGSYARRKTLDSAVAFLKEVGR
jgi:hypothetical protein